MWDLHLLAHYLLGTVKGTQPQRLREQSLMFFIRTFDTFSEKADEISLTPNLRVYKWYPNRMKKNHHE